MELRAFDVSLVLIIAKAVASGPSPGVRNRAALCGMVAGRVGFTCRTMVLKYYLKSRMQLPSILCAALSSH